jgi:hypothetical protein
MTALPRPNGCSGDSTSAFGAQQGQAPSSHFPRGLAERLGTTQSAIAQLECGDVADNSPTSRWSSALCRSSRGSAEAREFAFTMAKPSSRVSCFAFKHSQAARVTSTSTGSPSCSATIAASAAIRRALSVSPAPAHDGFEHLGPECRPDCPALVRPGLMGAHMIRVLADPRNQIFIDCPGHDFIRLHAPPIRV